MFPSWRTLAMLSVLVLFGSSSLLVSCSAQNDEDGIIDEEPTGAVSLGKADNTTYTPCIIEAMLVVLNAPSTTYDELRALKLSASAAKNIIAHRDGSDGIAETADDDPFDDLVELDNVPWVGAKVIERLAASVADQCPSGVLMEAVFSPQPYAESHLPFIVQIIDGAQQFLDIAMYNISDSKIFQALGRAVDRGVKVRFLSENARLDRKKPAGSVSARLEDLGVDVRYVNKIMHHKLMLADGPRADTMDASQATLVTGSANWSMGAATRYDENTVFLSGVPKLTLLYQQEFNRLWEHSADFVWNSALVFETGVALDPATFPQNPDLDALFTSANFSVKEGSTTFRLQDDQDAVADAIVAEIKAAQHSIHVASGHLRSRPISEALMAAKQANPQLDIRVYLDGQEYLSLSSHDQQLRELEECLQQAGDSQSKQRHCKDKGFLFSYEVSQSGVDLRYKYYAYRWDYSYAKQMHNKFIIIDGQTLITGSYNLSDNAEHNTFENMLVLRAPHYQGLIDRFIATFEALWSTDEDRAQLSDLQQKITSSSSIPLVFPPMALSWSEVNMLKQLIWENCSQVNSTEFRKNPSAHQYCPRN